MNTPHTTRPPGRGWAYTGAVLGAIVSVAANVAHSYVPPVNAAADWRPHTGAVIGTVFWPVALLVAVEILARTLWPTGGHWVILRWLGLLPVAVVAAFVSYRHLSALLTFYGEDSLTSMIGPLAVDGLMVMATGALIATAHTRTARATAGAAAPASLTQPADIRRVTTTPPADTATADITTPASLPAPRPAMSARSSTPRTPGRKASDTAAAVARLRARHPDMAPAEIARRLGVTDRTVRRHLTATPVATTDTGPDTGPDTGADTNPSTSSGDVLDERAA